MVAPTPMTAAEVLAHPEYPHVTWPLEPTSKGKASVAVGRGGPFNIAYELHGNGPIHLVVGGSHFHSLLFSWPRSCRRSGQLRIIDPSVLRAYSHKRHDRSQGKKSRTGFFEHLGSDPEHEEIDTTWHCKFPPLDPSISDGRCRSFAYSEMAPWHNDVRFQTCRMLKQAPQTIFTLQHDVFPHCRLITPRF